MTAIQTASAIAIASDFDDAVQIVLGTLAPTSARVYQHTYSAWQDFAAAGGFDSGALTFANVDAFVNQADVRKSTRQNRLSHMRKLLKLFAIGSDDARRHYQAVSAFCRVKAQDSDKAAPTRSQRALTLTEVRQLLDVYADDRSDKGIRNNALLRAAVYTGARRAELVNLRWTDIDLANCIITIRRGKGGQSRTIAIADATTGTCRALTALRELHRDRGLDSEFVFTALTRGKANKLQAHQMAADSVMKTVYAAAKAAGTGHISPHDLRRTHITLALESGAGLPDMQAQAGHARAETTLRYAQAVDAKARKARIEF